MEWVQHYASVDARKRLELGVAGERYKTGYSVDGAIVSPTSLVKQLTTVRVRTMHVPHDVPLITTNFWVSIH